MLKNTQAIRAAIVQVAKALGELNEQVVFVGGAMVCLYIDDPVAEDIRPTKDIDITFRVVSLSALDALREDLMQKGFKQS